MKKIIQGKIYNTETAVMIHEEYDHGMPNNDFNFYYEALYRTKKGQFFVCFSNGVRGAGRFFKFWSQNRVGNEEGYDYLENKDIILVDGWDAARFLEMNSAPTEIYQQYFPHLQEG